MVSAPEACAADDLSDRQMGISAAGSLTGPRVGVSYDLYNTREPVMRFRRLVRTAAPGVDSPGDDRHAARRVPRAALARHRPRRGHRLSIRRSAGVVRVKGEGAEITQGDTKTGKARVIDLDAGTVAALRAHRLARGGMALQLARDEALVFGDHEGRFRHPERFTRTFKAEVERCRKALFAEDAEPDPASRSSTMRATLLLAAGAGEGCQTAPRPRERDDHSVGVCARHAR